MNTFEFCVGVILEHEGGYSSDPNDPGGETNLGITWRTLEEAKKNHLVPQSTTVKGLTRDQAVIIYRALYWNEVKGDLFPPMIALCLFDAAVNQGVKTAILMLQQRLGVTADGVIGPKTLAAAKNAGDGFVDRFMATRIAAYADLAASRPVLKQYRSGWFARTISTARQAERIRERRA